MSPFRLVSTSGTLSLSWYYDYVATSPYPLSSLQTIELANEELVFVGYGINAPDLGWNDYKVNVTGKVLICFVGQPKSGVWADQPYRWYSRWVYKYEEASRQGAKAIFLVHTPSSAEYEWNVVQAGWGYAKARQEATSTAVPLLTGWVTEYYGGEIAASCNSTLEEWFNEAELAEFIPQPIPLDISVSVTFTCVDFSGTNTLGMKKGSTTETVVILGHIDGVGMKNGTVYPGAIDNAAGSSVVMEIAYAWSQMTLDDPLERSIIFLLATAEEAGLFGSDYFVNHLPTALEQGTKLVAGLNFDSPNTWGATYDMGGEGADKSTLGALEEWAAEKEDITFITGVSGSGYFRGDQWSLSKQGIPAIWPRQGTNFIDKPEHYLEDVVIPFESTCYHQPCDAYRENSDLSGMVQGMALGVHFSGTINAAHWVVRMVRMVDDGHETNVDLMHGFAEVVGNDGDSNVEVQVIVKVCVG
ncbi:peptidase M28 [Pelomyxa schiedti]|nr:peptidase M28 [Pelomyxa schiedti]